MLLQILPQLQEKAETKMPTFLNRETNKEDTIEEEKLHDNVTATG